VWRPDTAPIGSIVAVHGWGDHSGITTRHTAEPLTSAGYAVYALDMRGHGRTEGLRGHFDRWASLLHDLELFLALVRRGEPGVPVFVMGHSLGGQLALSYCTQASDTVDGLILVCPALRAHVPWWQKLGARVVSAVRPTQVLYNVPNNPAYQADPMADRMIGTARLLAEMLGAMARTRAGLDKVRLPLHIIAGRHDPVVHVPEVNELLRLVGATDKQLKVYEATAHNPFDQADAPRVLADLLAWLQSRRK
jgi:alpha-beta hydrolase superfamily lysophospholipase